MSTNPATPSISYSFTMRLAYPNHVGMLARIVSTIGKEGGDIGAVDIVASDTKGMTRDITVRPRDATHQDQIIARVRRLSGVKVINVSDRVFLLLALLERLLRLFALGDVAHDPLQQKLAIEFHRLEAVAHIVVVDQRAHKPEPACFPSERAAADPGKAWQLTIKGNSVAVVSDGTAVLGLGDIGPEAAMPVMEGKAMLFKEFAGIDAYPICLRTKDTQEIIATVKNLSVGFGGINLEDISAPRCFDVERELQAQLDIPVFHDDQHGTAVVVMAALLNALRLTRQKLERLRIVISGAGAAGMAVARILLRGGARDIVACDREGVLHEGRLPNLNESKAWLVRHTNPRNLRGRIQDALRDANVFIGVSGPGTLQAKHLRRMAPKSIVFALANPTPEIMPEEAARYAFIVATGRSDYPNQINNVLAFPGIFRGALNVRSTQITESMKQAAARAIAACIAPRELSAEYIVPSVFNRQVVQRVAAAVQRAALQAGVAGKRK